MNGNNKPIISWWKSGDPCLKIPVWLPKLTDVNIINTKHLTNEFIDICLKEKHRIFLHVNITGMGKTIFEPNIPTVKETFFQLKKLIDSGFPQKQILVMIDPILPNENGLKALKLLLRIFTEFKDLRLRYVRFNVLTYRSETGDNGKINYTLANQNIGKRPSTKAIGNYLFNVKDFFKDYYKLLDDYQAIITIDKGEESIIGVRELSQFGLKNEWFDVDGNRTKLIFYDNNNRFKPIVNMLSEKRAVRCSNRCLLCPYLF